MKIKYKIKWCFRFRLSRTQFASQQWAPAVSPLPRTCSAQVSSSTIIFIKLSLTCLLNTGGENGKDACGVSFFLDWYLLSLELVISDDNESWVTIYFNWWWWQRYWCWLSAGWQWGSVHSGRLWIWSSHSCWSRQLWRWMRQGPFFIVFFNPRDHHHCHFQEGLYGVYADIPFFRTWIDETIAAKGGATFCS